MRDVVFENYVFEGLDRIDGAESYVLTVDDDGVKVEIMKKDGGSSVWRWAGLTNYGIMELLNCLDEYFDEDM